jgi:ABC-2 type transport system permease protein
MMSKTRRNQKRSAWIQLLLLLVVIVFVNLIVSFLPLRFDLTANRLYSVSDETRRMLKNLDDIVYFQIYLDGQLPPDYRRLKKAAKEMLDEFHVISDKVQYEFINPSASDDPRDRMLTQQNIEERGLVADQHREDGSEGVKFRKIFPGAIVTYQSREMPLQFLQSERFPMRLEQRINRAINEIEFSLAYAISILSREIKPKIAFIEGHGELGRLETADVSKSLADNYIVERVRLNEQVNILTERVETDSGNFVVRNKYRAIIIAGPDSVFSEKDKFIIDQYVMYGGSVLWLIDPVFARMDSLQFTGVSMGITHDVHLDDLLFNYGVRLNTDLVMDLIALPIGMVSGSTAGQPNIEFFPWYFFPLVASDTSHPVVNNVGAVKTEFVSSIDTISVRGIKKTFLLRTSPYSRRLNAPVYINLNIVNEEPDRSLYNLKNLPVAVLLEGEFNSLYKNRIPPALAGSREISFLESSRPTAMIIVSDGDVIKNQFHYSQGYPLPLGYDQYTGETFGNKRFILNAIDYLVSGTELNTIRQKNFSIPSLDNAYLKDHGFSWRLANSAIPPLVVIIFGIAYAIIRRKRYASPKK